MKPRKREQIIQDLPKVIEASGEAKSLTEIGRITGLSYDQVILTLEGHPNVETLVREMLKNNKKKERKNLSREIVIDASITGLPNIVKELEKRIKAGEKIILTSITIQELDRMQKFDDKKAKDVRKILQMAAKEPIHFHSVLIDESVGIPDDCIIKYCADNKKKVILITSDKVMTLKARMYGVKVEYLEQYEKKAAKQNTFHSEEPASKEEKQRMPEPEAVASNEVNLNTSDPEELAGSKEKHKKQTPKGSSDVVTLVWAEKRIGKLIIPELQDFKRNILVIKGGREYSMGNIDIERGDIVYVATKDMGGIVFSHYEIINVNAARNARLIYTKKFYKKKMNNVPERYKRFLTDCWLRFDA